MNLIHKLTNWYLTKEALPYWFVLTLDCLIVLVSGLLSHYLRFGGNEISNYFWDITRGMIISMPFFMVGFRMFHTYQGVMRYSTYMDLYRIGKANFVGCLLAGIFTAFVTIKHVVFPDYKLWLAIFFISTMAMWVVRLATRSSFETMMNDNATSVAIYGTRVGGFSIAQSLLGVKEKQYNLRAFISDQQEYPDKYLLGKKVLLNGPDIVGKLTDIGVKVLFVSPLKTDLFLNNQHLIDELTDAGIKIMMMSTAEEWDGKSEVSYSQLHEVEIEDLLPRDEIKVDMDAIASMLTGKRVLITGAAGSIGSEMVRQVASFKPSELVLIDQAETPMHDIRRMMATRFHDVTNETIVTSITDAVHMEKIFSQHRPEYVFHAAAYKHVPMMEDNPAQAVRNNINGTRIIADLAVKYGTKKFVMISTDKAVNPTNVMGCSKRICEIYCQSLNQAIVSGKVEGITQFVTTRFGNVLGSNGSVIPIFREQIKKGGPITVTHPDIIRYFMLISEACKLVLEAGTMGKGGEIFVFDMGNPVKIVDLAKRMIALSGAKNISIKFTGLRDGEKLYEEVLNDKEGTVPTHHQKIMVAKVREYDYEVAKQNEDELLRLSYSHDDMAIVKKMKAIVPEYKSHASKYEVLD